MKKYLFCFFVGAISITLNSCNNKQKAAQQAREKAIADSVQQREAFVRDSTQRELELYIDSITKVEAAEKEETIKKYKKSFDEQYDEFQEITWVKPKNRPEFINQNAMYAYFCIKDEKPCNFRFRFQYFDDDWLFVKKMIFNIDGDNITITPSMKRDCNSSGIWEYCDVHIHLMGEITESFIERLVEAKTVKVRLYGKYSDTRNITKRQLETLKNTYEYYKALGGKF